MDNTPVSIYASDTAFDLQISELLNIGNLLHEQLVLNVNRDCDTSQWLVCSVRFGGDRLTIPTVQRTFLLPMKRLAINDTIRLWTKRGRDWSEGTSDGMVTHHFHLRLKAPIWERGNMPFIFKISYGHGGLADLNSDTAFGGTGISGVCAHG